MKAHVSKTILFDPERFVQDTYSMWNFIELEVGIIAASLPALKPLFNRFLEATRSVVPSQPTKTSRYSFREPASLGYARQHDESDSNIEMRRYKGGGETTIKITSPLPDTSNAQPCKVGRAHSCDSAVPPLQGRDSDSKAILVTKNMHVE
jgi:hypothetical protein